jgi:uncharacterized protein YbjT (DUF2867 family)
MLMMEPAALRAESATVLVAGATGRTGRLLVPALLAAGYRVRALARRPTVATDAMPSPEWVVGDVSAPLTLVAPMRGVAAVISAIGGRAPWGAAGFRAIDWEGNRALIDAARAAGVRRFILVTAASAGRSGVPYSWPIAPYPWKARAEALLRASGLDYTILGPGGLTDGSADRQGLRVTARADYRTGMVARADLAALAVFCLGSARTIGKTLAVVNDATLAPGAWRSAVEALPGDEPRAPHSPV